MTAQLWWRKFSRVPGPDVANVADADFMKKNFENDFFGNWLQEGQNASIHTHDELLRVFYRKLALYHDLERQIR